MAAASAAPLGINGAVKMSSTSQAFLDSGRVKETKSLISEQFYHLCNWVSGAGGSNSITIKLHHHSIPKPQQLIVMSLSGGQKERMLEEDMCVLSPSGSVLSQPLAKPRPHKPPKCSDCGPLFMKRVLRRHRNAEVTTKAGTLKNGIEPQRRCILLDIEGTTTPISFVTDVLFPYARDSVGKHLELTYDTAETQDDIKLLRAQVQEDLENDVVATVPIPTDRDNEDIIAALVANVEAMIKADRKITSLKQLQGHIWQTGFQNKELEAVVYDDVPEAIEKWHSLGIKVYIYSSGSRLAQRLIFGNTNYGDLRKHLCGFFDTKVGNKREKKSYIEIAESLGVDSPSEILFVTDVYQEAIAARAAGLEVIISIRPGNAPLPENHGFHTINSFSEI